MNTAGAERGDRQLPDRNGSEHECSGTDTGDLRYAEENIWRRISNER